MSAMLTRGIPRRTGSVLHPKGRTARKEDALVGSGGSVRRARSRLRSKAAVMTLVTAVAALLAFPATSVGDTTRVRARGESGDWHWHPAKKTITKGDRVVWKNPTDARHTVTAYKGRWSKNTTVEPGERTRKRFRRTGTYKYRCLTQGHSDLQNGRCVGMCGVIKVTR